MTTKVVADPAALYAAAAAAREEARAVRLDALATNWRSSGDRLAATDLRVELAWTVFQKMRQRHGLIPATLPIRQCAHPACRVTRCGRPPGT